MPTNLTEPFSRRTFLTAAAAAAFAGPLLSGCSSSSSPGGKSGSGSKVAMPTHVPFNGVPPDLPGDIAKGINPGYLSYPAEHVKTVHGKVGSGGAFRVFVTSFSPPPPPKAQNSYWQAINAALGVDLKPTLVPQEFPTKLAAMLSSGDIPDLVTMYLADAQSVRRFETVARSRFANLSEHLSGDAVKKYPNLARLAPDSWSSTLIDGEIYSTPTLRIPTGQVLYLRDDRVKAAGADPNPTSIAEFEQLCKALSDPGKKRWALANPDSVWNAATIYPLFGVPNGWRLNPDGSLTKDYETEEWQEAVAFMAKTWKAGYWHPNSPTMSDADGDTFFENGSVAMRQDSVVRYAIRGKVGFLPSIMKPFSADGGTVTTYEGSVTDFVTFVKKGSKARVEESLRILNWLNAPFGSEEYFLRAYGVAGKDHTLAGGQPKLSETGTSEVQSLSLRFVGGGPDVLYASNGNTPMVKTMHAYQTAVSPSRVKNPTTGLYSEAASTSGTITQQVTDTINDVVLGRKPASALKAAVAAWKKNGGDKVRADYEKAIAERTSGKKATS
ncbi:extracellular solute-binding protein [Luteipulveratus mongoliensis]|nr:extracellular solute-binding protein [Luteipulveratus mongoliensis]